MVTVAAVIAVTAVAVLVGHDEDGNLTTSQSYRGVPFGFCGIEIITTAEGGGGQNITKRKRTITQVAADSPTVQLGLGVVIIIY